MSKDCHFLHRDLRGDESADKNADLNGLLRAIGKGFPPSMKDGDDAP